MFNLFSKRPRPQGKPLKFEPMKAGVEFPDVNFTLTRICKACQTKRLERNRTQRSLQGKSPCKECRNWVEELVV